VEPAPEKKKEGDTTRLGVGRPEKKKRKEGREKKRASWRNTLPKRGEPGAEIVFLFPTEGGGGKEGKRERG